MHEDELHYVETEGGPFILLPLELKKAWHGVGDEDDEDDDAESDYDRAAELVSTVGVLDVGKGKALILGEAEVTAFRPTRDGGVFVQRVFGDEDAQVIEAVERAIEAGKWKATELVLPIEGKGKLALFDSACEYADADEDEVLKITLAPGTYVVSTARVKTKDIEAGLVRLQRK